MAFRSILRVAVVMCVLVAAGPGRAQAPSTGPATAPSTAPARETCATVLAWHRQHVADAYERVGRRNPKWDEPARQVIAATARMWCQDHTPTADERDVIRVQGVKAIQSGCDDPVVLYVTGNTLGQHFRERGTEACDYHIRAARAVEESKDKTYHPAVRCIIFSRAAEWNMRYKEPKTDEAKRLMKLAQDQWAAIAQDPSVPRRRVMELFDIYGQCAAKVFGDREAACAAAFEQMQKHCADQPFLLTFMTRFYIDKGWDARGMGFADTVTPEGWKKLHEGLEQAKKSAEEAWSLDANNAELCGQMMRVALHDPDGARLMNTWFARAVAADPTNLGPYRQMLGFLEPKWHGGVREMVAFGRKCLETGKWDVGVPLILVDAHATAARYTPQGLAVLPHPGYFAGNEAAWKIGRASCRERV